MRFLSFLETPIVEKDALSGKYIAYYKSNLEVISEGATEIDAKNNLRRDIKFIKKFKASVKEKEQKANANHRIAHS